MSTLSVTTINTANATTDLTLATGNNSAGKIVIPSSGSAIKANSMLIQVATNNWALQCNTNANNASGIWMESGGAGQLALRDNNANLATISTSAGGLTTSGALTTTGNFISGGTVTDSTATLRPFIISTAVALSTQATVDFNNIPSWVKKISVVFFAVSLTGTNQPLIQLGTGTSGSPSFATSGYQSYNSDSGRTSTAGFIGPGGSSGDSRYGVLQIINQDGNKWVAWGIINSSTSNEQRTIGQVTLGGALTQLRLTRTGSDTFDAGNINILYE